MEGLGCHDKLALRGRACAFVLQDKSGIQGEQRWMKVQKACPKTRLTFKPPFNSKILQL